MKRRFYILAIGEALSVFAVGFALSACRSQSVTSTPTIVFSRVPAENSNGCGIDPQVLRAGRDGHWGPPGMRERAEKVGAKLRVWSRAAAGTEVELTVPGQVAFQSPESARPRHRFARFNRRPAAQETNRPESKRQQ